MAEVIEKLKGAQYYYMDEAQKRRSIEYLYTKDQAVSCFHTTHILKDGSLGITGHTSTLKALEKRGLIEIVELGGDMMDIVKLKGFEAGKPLTKANKINIHNRYYSDYCGEWIERDIAAYATEGGVEHFLKTKKESHPHIEVQPRVQTLL